jgi:hypothetical protein
VLRVEMQARSMPVAFPPDAVELALDYDYGTISERTYLLPTHAEMLTCTRGTDECRRSVSDFENYETASGSDRQQSSALRIMPNLPGCTSPRGVRHHPSKRHTLPIPFTQNGQICGRISPIREIF